MTSTSNTGRVLKIIIEEHGTTQYGVAASAGVSQPYLNQVVRGRRKPSADWIDLVADAMKLNAKERARLHRAGAVDNGFKIDI